MSRVLAVANSKGGVAKTTTAAALAAAFAELGRRVLLLDLDPQACLTFALGADLGGDGALTSADVLGGRAVRDAVVVTEEGVDLVPAGIELAGLEHRLVDVPEREHVLRRAVEQVADDYDDVVLDCAPSLGLLTVNALVAADGVLVPLAAEMLGHRAVGQLLDTVSDVRALLNPSLEVVGLLPTMVDLRGSHARAVVEDLGPRYGLPVLGPVPRSVRVAEAPARGLSVIGAAGRTAAAQAYRQVALALVRPRG